MRIAIIGSVRIGGHLARQFTPAGHDLMVSLANGGGAVMQAMANETGPEVGARRGLLSLPRRW